MPADPPVRKPRARRFVVVIMLLLTLLIPPRVWAWGQIGHRVTARIAEKYLNPKAKAAVVETKSMSILQSVDTDGLRLWDQSLMFQGSSSSMRRDG